MRKRTLLQKLRLASGMTQEDAACAAGVSPRALQNWEGERTLPTPDGLMRLLASYNASLEVKREVVWHIYGEGSLDSGNLTISVTNGTRTEEMGEKQYEKGNGIRDSATGHEWDVSGRRVNDPNLLGIRRT